jgi:hypothetical protein
MAAGEVGCPELWQLLGSLDKAAVSEATCFKQLPASFEPVARAMCIILHVAPTMHTFPPGSGKKPAPDWSCSATFRKVLDMQQLRSYCPARSVLTDAQREELGKLAVSLAPALCTPPSSLPGRRPP